MSVSDHQESEDECMASASMSILPRTKNVRVQVRTRTKRNALKLNFKPSKRSAYLKDSMESFRDAYLGQNKLSGSYEVHYMKNLKTCMERLGVIPGVEDDCNTTACPSLKERLERHRAQFHAKPSHHQVASNTSEYTTGGFRNVPSKHRTTSYHPMKSEVSSIQSNANVKPCIAEPSWGTGILHRKATHSPASTKLNNLKSNMPLRFTKLCGMSKKSVNNEAYIVKSHSNSAFIFKNSGPRIDPRIYETRKSAVQQTTAVLKSSGVSTLTENVDTCRMSKSLNAGNDRIISRIPISIGYKSQVAKGSGRTYQSDTATYPRTTGDMYYGTKQNHCELPFGPSPPNLFSGTNLPTNVNKGFSGQTSNFYVPKKLNTNNSVGQPASNRYNGINIPSSNRFTEKKPFISNEQNSKASSQPIYSKQEYEKSTLGTNLAHEQNKSDWCKVNMAEGYYGTYPNDNLNSNLKGASNDPYYSNASIRHTNAGFRPNSLDVQNSPYSDPGSLNDPYDRTSFNPNALNAQNNVFEQHSLNNLSVKAVMDPNSSIESDAIATYCPNSHNIQNYTVPVPTSLNNQNNKSYSPRNSVYIQNVPSYNPNGLNGEFSPPSNSYSSNEQCPNSFNSNFMNEQCTRGKNSSNEQYVNYPNKYAYREENVKPNQKYTPTENHINPVSNQLILKERTAKTNANSLSPTSINQYKYRFYVKDSLVVPELYPPPSYAIASSSKKQNNSQAESNTCKFKKKDPILYKDCNMTQTKLTFANMGNIAINIAKKPDVNNEPLVAKSKEQDYVSQGYTKSGTANPTRNTFVELNIGQEVRQWEKDVPHLLATTKQSDIERENTLKMLINKLIDINKNGNNKQCESLMKLEIPKFVEQLKFWYPGDKRNQRSFINDMTDKLIKRIRELKVRCYGANKYDDINMSMSFNSDNTCTQSLKSLASYNVTHNALEDEILHWLDNKNLLSSENTTAFNRKDITNLLITRLEPFISKSYFYNSTNKVLMNEKIAEVLDIILRQDCVDSSKMQNSLLLKYADDLSNRILKHHVELKKIMNTSPNHRNKNNENFRTEYAMNLGKQIWKKVRDCLADSNLSKQKRLAEEITIILMKNHEIVRIADKSIKNKIINIIKNDIVEIINKSVKLNGKEILNCANCILKHVFGVVKDHEIPENSVYQTKAKSEPEITVLASEVNLNQNTVTTSISENKFSVVFHKNSSILTRACLSAEEEIYLEQLADVTREWFSELSHDFNAQINESFKENMIQELALEIVTQTKLNKAPIPETKKQKLLHFTIYKWLYEYEVFEDTSKAEPKIKDLETKLAGVPVHQRHRTDIKQPTKTIIIKEVKNSTQTPLLFTTNKNKIDRLNLEEVEPYETDPKYNQQSAGDVLITKRHYDPLLIIKNYILHYLEYVYKVDDAIARKAFLLILKTEIKKLSDLRDYDATYINKSKIPFLDFEISPRTFDQELDFIEEISNWLKMIPLAPLVHRADEKQRVEFIITLAKYLVEIEKQRRKKPNDINYDIYEIGVISELTRQLPINSVNEPYISKMIEELQKKITIRYDLPTKSTLSRYCCLNDNLNSLLDKFSSYHYKNVNTDKLRQKACTKRVIDEIKHLIDEDPSLIKTFEKYIGETEDHVTQFIDQLKCVKEISDWIKNLPLSSSNLGLSNMVSEMAQKVAERNRKSLKGDRLADYILIDYISKWVLGLPLNVEDISSTIAIKQIVNRINAVNDKYGTIPYNNLKPNKRKMQNNTQFYSCLICGDKTNKSRKCCKDCCKTKSPSNSDVAPEEIIEYTTTTPAATTEPVYIIEEWSKKLPLHGKGKTVEETKRRMTSKLFETVRELNENPLMNNDNDAYKTILEDKIDTELSNIPKDVKLFGNRKHLKNKLVNEIIDAKIATTEVEAGEMYEKKLEDIIDSSMPNPLQPPQRLEKDPSYELFKHKLVENFIIENFDHGNNVAKRENINKTKACVDMYIQSAKKRNSIAISDDQLYNELYGSLYKVKVPNEQALQDQVEEVKTRLIVEEWFNDIPLQESAGIGQLLEWNEMIRVLVRKILETEKKHPSNDAEMNTVIEKWVQKLPLQPGFENRVEEIAQFLTIRLRKSKEAVKGTSNIKKQSEINLNVTTHKKSANITMEILEDWTHRLPLPHYIEEMHALSIKSDIMLKLMLKITELNSDPTILNNDVYYDHLLDGELDNIFTVIPISLNPPHDEEDVKRDLKEKLKAVRPLVREEQSRYEYVHDLQDKVVQTLRGSTKVDPQRIDEIKEEAAYSFVEYSYSDAEHEKLEHKKKITNLVDKLDQVKSKKSTVTTDSMMKTNQLITEMSKVSAPNDTVVMEILQNLKIRREIEKFFEENKIVSKRNKDNYSTKHIEAGLAKELTDIERAGYTPESTLDMKRKITKYVRLLNKEISPEKVNGFVSKLKQGANSRNIIPKKLSFSNNSATSQRNPLPIEYTASPSISTYTQSISAVIAIPSDQSVLPVVISASPDDKKDPSVVEESFALPLRRYSDFAQDALTSTKIYQHPESSDMNQSEITLGQRQYTGEDDPAIQQQYYYNNRSPDYSPKSSRFAQPSPLHAQPTEKDETVWKTLEETEMPSEMRRAIRESLARRGERRSGYESERCGNSVGLNTSQSQSPVTPDERRVSTSGSGSPVNPLYQFRRPRAYSLDPYSDRRPRFRQRKLNVTLGPTTYTEYPGNTSPVFLERRGFSPQSPKYIEESPEYISPSSGFSRNVSGNNQRSIGDSEFVSLLPCDSKDKGIPQPDFYEITGGGLQHRDYIQPQRRNTGAGYPSTPQRSLHSSGSPAVLPNYEVDADAIDNYTSFNSGVHTNSSIMPEHHVQEYAPMIHRYDTGSPPRNVRSITPVSPYSVVQGYDQQPPENIRPRTPVSNYQPTGQAQPIEDHAQNNIELGQSLNPKTGQTDPAYDRYAEYPDINLDEEDLECNCEKVLRKIYIPVPMVPLCSPCNDFASCFIPQHYRYF